MTTAHTAEAAAAAGSALTPREIVGELDKYVVGQAKAKRAVAIAIRNPFAGSASHRIWPTTSYRRTSS